MYTIDKLIVYDNGGGHFHTSFGHYNTYAEAVEAAYECFGNYKYFHYDVETNEGSYCPFTKDFPETVYFSVQRVLDSGEGSYTGTN